MQIFCRRQPPLQQLRTGLEMRRSQFDTSVSCRTHNNGIEVCADPDVGNGHNLRRYHSTLTTSTNTSHNRLRAAGSPSPRSVTHGNNSQSKEATVEVTADSSIVGLAELSDACCKEISVSSDGGSAASGRRSKSSNTRRN